MNVLRALALTLEYFSFSSDFDNFVYFFSSRTRHLRWIDHSTDTTPSTGLKKKKKKTTVIIR